MSTNQSAQIANIKQVVSLVEPDFNQLAKIHGAVNFKKEASFALQILKGNEYLARIAAANQDSLKTAILNVAAIGLSLSPVEKLAYLVPRKGTVCLDISYRGYVQLAVDVGSIKWAHAEIVCENDTFKLRGLGVEPLHNFEPFGERGKIVGAYCIGKTHDGDYLTSLMTWPEIESIRNRSESWKAYVKDNSKLNPWVTDESEMIKKTVIRRAYKSWPMTNTRARFDKAIDVTSEADPIEFNSAPAEALPSPKIESIRTLLATLEKTEEAYVAHLSTIYNRKISSVEELTEMEMDKAIAMLESFVKAAERKATASEVKHENAG